MTQLARGRTRSTNVQEVTKETSSTAPTTPTTLNSLTEPGLQTSPTSSKTSLSTIEQHTLAFSSTPAAVPTKFNIMPAKQASRRPSPISKKLTAPDVSQIKDIASRSGRARKPTEKAQQLAASGSKYYASLNTNDSVWQPKDESPREVSNEGEADLTRERRKSTSAPTSLQEPVVPEESSSSIHSENKKVSGQAEKPSVVELDMESIITSAHDSSPGPRKRKSAGRVLFDDSHSIKRTRAMGTATTASELSFTVSPSPDLAAARRVPTSPPLDLPSTQRFSKASKGSIDGSGSAIDDTTLPVRITRMKKELSRRPTQLETLPAVMNSQPATRRNTRRSTKAAECINIDIEGVPTPTQENVQKSNSPKSTSIEVGHASRTIRLDSSKAQQTEGLRQVQDRPLQPVNRQQTVEKGETTNPKNELSPKHLVLSDTEPPSCQLGCLDTNETLLAFAEIANDIPDRFDHDDSAASHTEDERLQQELNGRLRLYCKCKERDLQAGGTDSASSVSELSGLVKKTQERILTVKSGGQQEVMFPKTAATNLKILGGDGTVDPDTSSQNMTPVDTSATSVAKSKASLKLKLNAPKQVRHIVKLKIPRMAARKSDDDNRNYAELRAQH